ncbi:MAG: hypothetical protein WC511_02795 [Candidatus Pacearchaeota archaeon]
MSSKKRANSDVSMKMTPPTKLKRKVKVGKIFRKGPKNKELTDVENFLNKAYFVSKKGKSITGISLLDLFQETNFWEAIYGLRDLPVEGKIALIDLFINGLITERERNVSFGPIADYSFFEKDLDEILNNLKKLKYIVHSAHTYKYPKLDEIQRVISEDILGDDAV